MVDYPEYRRAYEKAQRELAELLEQQQKIEKRLVIVRQNIQGLKTLCESENVKVTPSQEAEYLLQNSKLPDEIVNILRTAHPEELRPSDIKAQLEKLGHDMSEYTNPLATIHMLLKRLVEARKITERIHAQGFKIYQFRQRTLPRLDATMQRNAMSDVIDKAMAAMQKKK